MKKLIILFSLIASILMVGCSSAAVQPAASNSTDNVEADTKPEEEKDEPETAPVEEENDKEDADEHYLNFLKGIEKTDDGNSISYYIDTDEELQPEYALYDMNDDGQNELLIRSYGSFIPGIFVFEDNKVKMLYMDYAMMSGLTRINTKNQFVSGDTGHVGRDYFSVEEIDGSGEVKPVLSFGMEYEDYDETKEQSFFKYEYPADSTSYDYDLEDRVEITEEEYEALFQEYTQENRSISWQKFSQLTDGGDNDTVSDMPSAQIDNADEIIKAYDDFMAQNYNREYGNVEISLIYLSDDNVPEAVIQQDGDISWTIIGYEDGKAVPLAGCDIDSLIYEPKGNHFYFDWCDGESTGIVACTLNGDKVDSWSIDEIYTTQGTEYYYSDDKTNRKQLSEAEAKKYRNEASRGCIQYMGEFYPDAREAFGNLMDVGAPAVDAERELRIKSASASSTLVASSVDGMTYVAENLYDDDFSTPWVEGADGVGIGEKITIKLDGVHEVRSLFIYNGILKSKRRCMINGQVTKIEIDWGNGNKQTADVDVVNYPEEEKAILLSDLTPAYIQPDKECKTDTITITILGAMAGSKYEDVGISEIKVYGK